MDDLDRIKVELEANGVHKAQIHVFSKDDTGVETHDHLHNMESVFKNDVVHGTITGAWIGAAIATLILIVTSYSNWPETYTWMPFIFLAIVMLGFGAWAGGL
ncbi:MAG: NAD/FAD-utilizing enzyme, partial [Gammaproteobacteria bacterium]|nr:NAD/FAD-utilizing enzyme [Gammaproteobacteria bacterium]